MSAGEHRSAGSVGQLWQAERGRGGQGTGWGPRPGREEGDEAGGEAGGWEPGPIV